MSSQEFEWFSYDKLICRITRIGFTAHQIQHFNRCLF